MKRALSGMSRMESQQDGDDPAETARRRLTLARMLIWAAQEAREIDLQLPAEHLDRAVGSIGDQIRDRQAWDY